MTPWVVLLYKESIMPGRKVVLANNEIYHVLNRGVASQPVFFNKRDYQRALNTIFYYQNKNLTFKYSYFITHSKDEQEKIIEKQKREKNYLIEIISFCLMPNHFHLLLKQSKDNGIAKFVSNFTNSYTRYFNTKNERNGHLFQGKFQAIRIETEEQLLHVSRYIHLNPYTSFIIKDFNMLEKYPYSSLPEYLNKINDQHCFKEDILYHFPKTQEYKKFIFNQADYQRQLSKIKHLILD